jgi:radical SAM protein with 4Fe4S-binding SPASM domain
MPTVESLIKRLFLIQPPPKTRTVPSGLYHYMKEVDGDYTRFHLRVDRDGRGMLLANASAAAHLTISGVLIAQQLLEGADDEQIRKQMVANFRGATEEDVRRDMAQVQGVIDQLAAPGDTYPVMNLDDVAFSAREAQLIAPLRADVPLAPPDRLGPILEKLWAVGVPNVCILAPENPDASALIRAVERAEDLGLIAGVRARASEVQDSTLLANLAMAGVDYVTLPFASATPEIHDALMRQGDHAAALRVFEMVLNQEVCPVAEVALVEATLPGLEETLATLQQARVANVSFVAVATTGDAQGGALAAHSLPPLVVTIEEFSAEAQVRMLWQPPVEYDPAIPLPEQVRRGPRCSGDVAVRVESDGDVFPPRGPAQSAGNLLAQPWEEIWGHAAFRLYREQVEEASRCEACPGLALCRVVCPRERTSWSYDA